MIITITGATLNHDYIDGSLVVSLFLFAELIEIIVMNYVRKAVQLSSSGTIPSHTILQNGTKVAVADIKVGDVLSVRAGEMILADGRVIKGECVVDESALTGELIPLIVISECYYKDYLLYQYYYTTISTTISTDIIAIVRHALPS